ncbi:MAG: roadblock/LC7 domain-containing protein [Candidatus Heimdallarchaeota archaeon]|nr:roadblock/LC7 domain-containing protein [Candidatus Heimdallarchaeota archaeon]
MALKITNEQFEYLLQSIFENIEGVRSAAIVSQEGLVVHSVLEEGISEIKLAAMTATILSVAEKVLMELKSGILDVCIVQGDEGNFCVMEAGPELILAVCLNVDARMDTCFIEMRKVSEKIKKAN